MGPIHIQSFTLSPQNAPDTVHFSFNALPYKTYAIERSESLSPITWQSLGAHSLSTTNHHTLSVTYPLPPSSSSGFYRVIVQE